VPNRIRITLRDILPGRCFRLGKRVGRRIEKEPIASEWAGGTVQMLEVQWTDNGSGDLLEDSTEVEAVDILEQARMALSQCQRLPADTATTLSGALDTIHAQTRLLVEARNIIHAGVMLVTAMQEAGAQRREFDESLRAWAKSAVERMGAARC
jgi:hypothetical protein